MYFSSPLLFIYKNIFENLLLLNFFLIVFLNLFCTFCTQLHTHILGKTHTHKAIKFYTVCTTVLCAQIFHWDFSLYRLVPNFGSICPKHWDCMSQPNLKSLKCILVQLDLQLWSVQICLGHALPKFGTDLCNENSQRKICAHKIVLHNVSNLVALHTHTRNTIYKQRSWILTNGNTHERLFDW